MRQWHIPSWLWPRTLSRQLIAVTVLAVLLSNIAVLAWFGFGNQRNNDAAATERFLERVASTAVLLKRIPPPARETALHTISGPFGNVFALHTGPRLPHTQDTTDEKLTARLRTILPADMAPGVNVRRLSRKSAPPDIFAQRPFGEYGPGGLHAQSHDRPPPPDETGRDNPRLQHMPVDPHFGFPPLHRGRIIVAEVTLSPDMQLVAATFHPPAMFWSAQLILAALITILVASLAAAYLAQRVSRPLSKLAAAATVAARGGDAPHVPEEGPADVRRAAAAFNAMSNQVRRTMESQRHLLSAVGHDLRTPITAMRINMEFVEDKELSERLKKNLDELQTLTEAVLSAARGTSGEKMRHIDLSALVESLCADLDDLNMPVQWIGGNYAPLLCRPGEIRRAVRNLIENAVAYGKKAEVSVITTDQTIDIRVEDEGPGIAASDRERVLEPFVRLESSRNSATGGVGLGLTLVKSIAEGHGGSIHLTERQNQSGLSVRIRLPRASTCENA